MSRQQSDIELGPLYEPDPVSFSFDEPGWYMLFGITAALVLFLFYKWIRHYLKNGYRRQAIDLLKQVETKLQKKADAAGVNDVMIILKHVALTTYSRDEVSALQGLEWLSFLDQKGKKTAFRGHQEMIFSALYKDELTSPEQVPDLIHNAKRWIHEHS